MVDKLLSVFMACLGPRPFERSSYFSILVTSAQLCLHGASSAGQPPSTALFGSSVKIVKSSIGHGKASKRALEVMADDLDESKQTEKDKWRELAYDMSDDQQDIARGKGLVDSLFQAPMDSGTHIPIMSSYEYISQGLKILKLFTRLMEWDPTPQCETMRIGADSRFFTNQLQLFSPPGCVG